MEMNEYDLSNVELKESLAELEDDLLNEIIERDINSRIALNLVYYSIGLFD